MDVSGARARRRLGRLPRLCGTLGLAGLVVAGGVTATTGGASGGYRTTQVTRAEVEQTVDAVGTVEPVSQASVSFPIAGRVATVEAAVGASVARGQVLATLDVAALQVAINQRQAALDAAELALERALDGEDPGGSGPAVSAASTGSSRVADAVQAAAAGRPTFPTVAATAAVAAAAVADEELAAAQQAVLDGQVAVDAALADAQVALAASSSLCAAVGDPDAPPPDAAAITVCQEALADVQGAQQAVDQAQVALSTAAAALDGLLAQRAADLAEARAQAEDGQEAADPQGSSTSDRGGTGSSAGSASPGTGGSSSTERSSAPVASSSPSAADLVAYQAAVDQAAAELAAAQQALKQAVVVSPVDGTVVSVGMAVGDDVEAASATAAIVVVGPGGYEVTTTVGIVDLPDVEIGQRATVVPDGWDEPVEGEVVAIGPASVSTSAGAAYPVTVGLPDDVDLGNGTVAGVSIVTAAQEGLVVPTSAVHVEGGRSTVTVLEDGEPVVVPVVTGAVGPTWTAIDSGVAEGDEVVLADLDEPLPSSATDGSTSSPGGTFPGGFAGPAGGRIVINGPPTRGG